MAVKEGVVTSNAMDQLREENERLRAQVAATQRQLNSFKLGIGDKGGVKVQLGSRRFPVTLYASEWNVIVEHIDELSRFIVDNKHRLSWKNGTPE